MQTTYIITFIGDDRPGLVEALSEVISAQGGNWVESRLSQLAGKFAGLISITLPEASGDELRAALKGLNEAGISVEVTPCGKATTVSEQANIITLTILGPDRPGIVRETAAALSARKINVAVNAAIDDAHLDTVFAKPLHHHVLPRLAVRRVALIGGATSDGENVNAVQRRIGTPKSPFVPGVRAHFAARVVQAAGVEFPRGITN